MTPPQNEDTDPQGPERQAHAWIRHDPDAFQRPEVFAAFGAWLQADPRHGEAFIRLSLARAPRAIRGRPGLAEGAAERPAALQSRTARARGDRLRVPAFVTDTLMSLVVFVLIGLSALAIDFLAEVLRGMGLPALFTTFVHGATILIIICDVLALVLLETRAILRVLAGARVRDTARGAVAGG